MGGTNSKAGRKNISSLSETEIVRMKAQYAAACANDGRCTRNSLSKLWSKMCERHLQYLLVSYLFKNGTVIEFDTFITPYINVVLGSIDEKVDILIALVSNGNKDTIQVGNITDYVCSVVSSYIITMSLTKNSGFISWKMQNVQSSNTGLKLVTEFLCQDVITDSPFVSFDKLWKWVASWSLLTQLHYVVLRSLYNLQDLGIEDGQREPTSIPKCVNLNKKSNVLSILDLTDITCLNSQLPEELKSQWRPLFSTACDGESFSKLVGNIRQKGPTVIIIKDRREYVFGGFAPESWEVGPNFSGNDQSFLFSLRPAIHMYFPTGYNRNYQYLNIQQKTLPNGLGMGGQFGFFGFWLDAEFGHGHCSASCTTYKGYKMMSATKEFTIDHLEVWGVGEEPVAEKDEERSVLDKDREAQAILNTMGKTRYSEGYREPQD